MICRLCLIEAQSYLELFSSDGDVVEAEAIKMISKYFFLEVHQEDAVSNIICTVCWKHIDEFHRFWQNITEKQETLKEQWECPQIKRDVELVEFQMVTDPLNNTKDVTLCEPEIELLPDIDDYVDDVKFDISEEAIDNLLISSANLKHKRNVEPIATKPKGKTRGKYKTKKSKAMSKIGKSVKSSMRLRTTNNRKEAQNRQNEESASVVEDSTEICNDDVKGSMKNVTRTESLKSMIQEMDTYIAANTQLSCCLCAEAIKDFNHLKKHFRQVHQCNGYVQCCENRYKKRTLYFDHLKLHNDPDYFKCTICNKALASRNCYNNHMDTLHPSEEKLQYQCDKCPRKFSKQYILDYHIKSRHTTERNFKCEQCNKAFRNSAILKQHLKAVHLNEFGSVCEICGKQLKTAQNLLTHMESIHNYTQRPEVQCTVCLKWMKDLRCLNKHMIMHQDKASGQEFKCSQCDTVKYTRHALSAHIRYHHSFKTYKCTICEKEFKQIRLLEEHVSAHNGEHLHTCPFCPKTFRSHGNMYKHMGHSHSKEWVRKRTQPCDYTVKILKEMQSGGT